jgi:hypothetical protein
VATVLTSRFCALAGDNVLVVKMYHPLFPRKDGF